MGIWKREFNLEALQTFSANTLSDHLDMAFAEVGDDYLVASMPVSAKAVQPMRILHGGASVALAETIGSVASYLCLDPAAGQYAVGLSINANHLRPIPEGGTVTARCSPIHLGRTTHVWHIELTNEAGKTTCISRLTMSIVTPPK